MGLFDIFKTSTKTVDTALDLAKDASAGIDMMFFTDEEKSKISKEVMEHWLKVQTALKEESSIRSFTRRILAVFFCGSFLLFLTMAAVAFPFIPGYAGYLLQLADKLSTAVTTILIFYFGYYGVTKILEKK